MRTSSQEMSPQDTAVLRWENPRRRSGPIPSLGLAIFRFVVTLREPRGNTQIAAAE